MFNLTLEGHLQLAGNETNGTVALLDQGNEILAVTTADANGRFSLETNAASGLKLYGFPGQDLTDAQITRALSQSSTVYYETAVPSTTATHITLYLNGASSLVAAFKKNNPATAQPQAKAMLFGDSANILLPGYSTEFLAHLAPEKIYSHDTFLQKAGAAGGVSAFASQLTQQPAPSGSFAAAAVSPATRASSVTAKPGTDYNIPPSARWANNYDNWSQVLELNTHDCTDSMLKLSQVSDGLAVSAAAGSGDDPASEVAQALIKLTLAALSAGSQEQKIAGAVGTQVFGLVQGWIFGQTANPVVTMLKSISNQLNEVISSQITICNDLNLIMQEVKVVLENTILVALTSAISTIQSNAEQVAGYAGTKKGISATELSSLSAAILDTNDGVNYALTQIHNLIMGVSGSISLPSALFQCLSGTGTINGTNRNFLSNENFFIPIQTMFHYYVNVQTQGVQMVMQAQNYTAGAPTNITTPFSWSQNASDKYSKWLIGGSSGAKMAQQRDTYRALVAPYYNNFLGYMGALPDDMATGLLPQTSEKAAPVFYSIESKLLVFGFISYQMRQWTSGKIISRNDQIAYLGIPDVIAPQLRLPSKQEVQKLLGQGFTSSYYNGNYAQYLSDQGFSNDSSDYNSAFWNNVMVWTADTFVCDEKYGMYHVGNITPGFWEYCNVYPPYDINYQSTPIDNPWLLGTFPVAVSLQGNSSGSFSTYSGPYSSNPHDPQNHPNAWQCFYNWVYGAFGVADAKPLEINLCAIYDASGNSAIVMSAEGDDYSPYLYTATSSGVSGPDKLTRSEAFIVGHSALVLTGTSLSIIFTDQIHGGVYTITKDLQTGVSTWNGNIPGIYTQHKNGFRLVESVFENNNSHQHVVLIGKDDNQPYHIHQNMQDSNWGNLEALPNQHPAGYSDFKLAKTDSSILGVFLGTDDGQPYGISMNRTNITWGWNGNVFNIPSGKSFSALAFTNVNNNGQLILIGNNDHLPYLVTQDASTGAWTWQGELTNQHSAGFRHVTAVVDSNNNFHVFLTGLDDGMPYHIYQNAGSSWTWGGQVSAGITGKYENIKAVADNSGNIYLFMSTAANVAYMAMYSQGAWSFNGRISAIN